MPQVQLWLALATTKAGRNRPLAALGRSSLANPGRISRRRSSVAAEAEAEAVEVVS